MPGSPPAVEDVKAVSPEEVDMQARMERLRAGSKSVHFPLESIAKDSASETEDESETPNATTKHPGMLNIGSQQFFSIFVEHSIPYSIACSLLIHFYQF